MLIFFFSTFCESVSKWCIPICDGNKNKQPSNNERKIILINTHLLFLNYIIFWQKCCPFPLFVHSFLFKENNWNHAQIQGGGGGPLLCKLKFLQIYIIKLPKNMPRTTPRSGKLKCRKNPRMGIIQRRFAYFDQINSKYRTLLL